MQPDAEPEVAPIITTIEDEILARNFIRIVADQVTFVTDPLLTEYVIRLCDELARNAGFDSHYYKIFVVDDGTVNAIAGPGGTFMFYTGLFEVSETEGEFASVVAHEFAHHTQNHIRQMMAKHSATMLPSLLAVLAGIAVGGSEGTAASAGAIAAQREAMIDFTLHFEREADAIGLRILAASGYDPKHARNFMSSLQRWIRLRGARQSALHNTHPLTPERISNVEDRILAYNDRSYPKDSPEYYLAKARAKAMYAYKPETTSAHFKERLAADPGNRGHRYGYAISLSKDGAHEAARKEIATLLNQESANPWYILANAQIEIDAEKKDAAIELLEASPVAGPYKLAWAQVYAGLLIETGRAKEAKRLIRKQIIDHPDDPRLHSMHARASAQAGDQLNSHLSMAEHYYLLGALNAALQQIEVAQRFAGNSVYAIETIKEKKKIIQSEINWSQ